jgi:uncharacterized RDD family membrane protein YckC
MKKSTLALLILLLPTLGTDLARAHTLAAGAPSDVTSTLQAEEEHAEADSQSDEDPSRSAAQHRHRQSRDKDIVNLGGDSDLPQGERAGSVVAIFGSSSVAGETGETVSILGDVRVTGSVNDSAVAVFGDVYVDGAVDGDVVSVMGNVELGPHAVIGRDVVAVGGAVHRDPAATVHGNVQSVGGAIGGFSWLHPWIRHCLLYGRPLAFAEGLGWAWDWALVFLGLYIALALLFRGGVTRCVESFEIRPGMAVVAALLTVLLLPVILMLLFITLIGIAAIPFVAFILLCAGLFGKTIMLAWIGRRCLKHGHGARLTHPATAVLIGGLIVMALYVVPAVGFLTYLVLGLLGLGAVVYALIGNVRTWREARDAVDVSPGGSAATTSAPAGSPPAGSAPGAAAATAAGAASATGAASDTGAASATDAAPAAALVTAALPRAGFWIRMVALLLDALLVGVLMHLLHHMFDLELVMLAVYGAIMWKLRGSTIGGIVFDLQVVRLDGRPIDWQTAIVRALGCFLSLTVAGLGFFWIAFDRGRQAWHDKIAGTAVVRVAKGVPLI